MTARIVHETARRVRIELPPTSDLEAVAARIRTVTGVAAVRANKTVHCLVVQHDGRPACRGDVLREAGITAMPQLARKPARERTARRMRFLVPGVLAAAVPLLPKDWRPGAAMGVVAARVVGQTGKLRQDPAGVLLDATSLTALAATGQPLVVSASVLLRLWSEAASQRLVRQADRLLEQLLPSEAAQYLVAGRDEEAWLPVTQLRPGDRVVLAAGDIVPVDGNVAEGSGRVASRTGQAVPAEIGPGDHVPAGSRLVEGALTLNAEAAASASRLERVRGQLRYALAMREPAGALQPEPHRFLSLPLTAAAVVLGLTGDSTRTAAMLQADPQQGLDLAMPVAREGALYALARAGLLTAGLAAIERLATARVLALQDTAVLATGRWLVERVETALPEDEVLGWLTALAHTTPQAAAQAGFADVTMREWVRHGALLVQGEAELHLASPRRLQEVWGQQLPPHRVPGGPLRRELVFVRAGRLLASVTLASPLRPDALRRLQALRKLGFERIALFVEDAGELQRAAMPDWAERAGLEVVGPLREAGPPWLAQAAAGPQPLLFVHTVLRDLVPPGSLGLTPMDADAGSHGVLLDDPLVSLVAARTLARKVHRRLRRQQNAALVLNAVLMTLSAVRWLRPMGSALVHHGFALALLLDSHRLEGLTVPPNDPARLKEETQ